MSVKGIAFALRPRDGDWARAALGGQREGDRFCFKQRV